MLNINFEMETEQSIQNAYTKHYQIVIVITNLYFKIIFVKNKFLRHYIFFLLKKKYCIYCEHKKVSYRGRQKMSIAI